MALQTATTTPSPTGTQTVGVPGPDDTNANPNLLGRGDGTTPLVPAFILSGLLVVGVVMMCWWRRIVARRDGVVYAPGNARMGTGTGVRVVPMVGGGRFEMLMLAAHGPGWENGLRQLEREREREEAATAAGRRKKDVKVGPRPVLWDVYVRKEEVPWWRWRWRQITPVSASMVPRPKERVRLSVLIAMPTPRTASTPMPRPSPIDSKSKHSESAHEMEDTAPKNAQYAKEESAESVVDELNVVLGMAEVPIIYPDPKMI